MPAQSTPPAQPTLPAHLLAALLPDIGADHPAVPLAVAAAMTDPALLRQLAAHATEHRHAPVGLAAAIDASDDPYLLLAWATSGLAGDPEQTYRRAWATAAGVLRHQVAVQLPPVLLADICATATPADVALLAEVDRAGLAELLSERVRAAHTGNGDGGEEGDAPGFAEQVLEVARRLPPALAVTCLQQLPADPGYADYSAHQVWERRLRRLARRQPPLVNDLLRAGHGAEADDPYREVPYALRWAFTRLTEVWDLLDDEVLTAEVTELLGIARERLTGRLPVEGPADAPEETSAATADSVAAWLYRLRFLHHAPNRQYGDPGWDSPRPTDATRRALAGQLLEVTAQWLQTCSACDVAAARHAAALCGDLLAHGRPEAAQRRRITAVADVAQRGPRSADWRPVAEQLARTSAPADPLAELAADPTPARIIAAAWDTLRDGGTGFGDILTLAADPAATLTEMLTDAHAGARGHGVTGLRDAPVTLTAAVLDSGLATPAIICLLPIAGALSAELDTDSQRQIAPVLLTTLGDDAGAWQRLAQRIVVPTGVGAWQPLGQVLDEVLTTRTDERTGPAGVDDLTTAGLSLQQARMWAKTGLTVAEVRAWSALGVKASPAAAYRELGARSTADAQWCRDKLTAADARSVAAAKLPFSDVQQLLDAGVHPAGVTGYLAAGVKTTAKMLAYHAAGVSGPAARTYHQRGATTLTAIAKWRARGLTDTLLAQLDAYSVEEITKLVRHGVGTYSLGYDNVPHMDVGMITALAAAGVDVGWAPVLFRAGALTAEFLTAHREALRTTRPPYLTAWQWIDVDVVLTRLGGSSGS